MKVALDAFGGDYAPKEIVLGALESLKKSNEFDIVLFGDEEKIKKELENQTYDEKRISIVDAKEVISNNESPTMAIKTKKNSSLVKAFDFMNECKDETVMVSAGSTGAVLTGAFLKLKRIKGVSRPALAPILPTVDENKSVVLCDCGANVDCKPINLLHFGIMGSAFSSAMVGVENPKIGLLSNGVEDKKGNALSQETFAMLKQSSLNFVGNCEARDLLSGQFDVVVADGFDGNIALKTCEGTAGALFSLLKKGINDGGLRTKIGAGLMMPALKFVKKQLDYNEKGGACFLGVNKVVVKSHGASKAKSITASILQAVQLQKAGIVEKISAGVNAFEIENKKKSETEVIEK